MRSKNPEIAINVPRRDRKLDINLDQNCDKLDEWLQIQTFLKKQRRRK